jgi:two-component system, cell cycle response regulator DivK
MADITNVLEGWDVIVVDDEEDSLLVATMMMEMAGANVRAASNGREALSLIRQRRPRFVLSDLSMPEIDGWQLIRELQADRATMEIPVIALTAHAMTGDRERAIAAGFANYLTKPLDPDKFLSQLLGLLVAIPEFEPMLKG